MPATRSAPESPIGTAWNRHDSNSRAATAAGHSAPRAGAGARKPSIASKRLNLPFRSRTPQSGQCPGRLPPSSPKEYSRRFQYKTFRRTVGLVRCAEPRTWELSDGPYGSIGPSLHKVRNPTTAHPSIAPRRRRTLADAPFFPAASCGPEASDSGPRNGAPQKDRCSRREFPRPGGSGRF